MRNALCEGLEGPKFRLFSQTGRKTRGRGVFHGEKGKNTDIRQSIREISVGTNMSSVFDEYGEVSGGKYLSWIV